MKNIKIPWFKPTIGDKELKEVINSFRANWFTMGPKTRKLENRLAGYLNVPYALAVANGTVALDLAFKGIGISPSDEVIVPAMTYFATASAVSYQHAIPVFVDIEKETFNINPSRIREAITKKTKAIIYIDYGGNPAEYDEISRIARECSIGVIHDGAHSLGSLYKGKPSIGLADISTTSFHMAKSLTTVEGGMVFTRKKSIYKDIIMRRNQGEPPGRKYRHVTLGTNARMTDLQAAIGLAQMDKIEVFLKRRKMIAGLYDGMLGAMRGKITIPKERGSGSSNSYLFYPVLVRKRDKTAHALREKYGIDTRMVCPMPVYRQPAYSSGKLKCRKTACPEAESVCSGILNLPIFPSMTEKMVKYICRAISKEL